MFEVHGYDAVDTPEFELLEVIERGLGDRAKKTLFRMVDPATGEVVVLRPDFTAQVARMVVARLSERPRPLRLHYQGRVLRAADPLGRGIQHRDVCQAGAELIGSGEAWADVEVLALGVRALEHLEEPITIDLGHAAIVESMIPGDVDSDEVHLALAVKDAVRLRTIAPVLEPLIDLYGGIGTLSRARAALARAPEPVHRALDELERVANDLVRLVPHLAVSFDLGEQRGLGYYSGVFFHGYVRGAPDAVLMGGRYDGLLEKYGRGEPAVGLAIDVHAIAQERSPPPRCGGVVLSVRGAERSSLASEAERRRSTGERAVLVAAEHAWRYARVNGYRAVIEACEDGELTEHPVNGDPDR